MSNFLSERLLQVETDFIVGRHVEPNELLELLKHYGDVNLVGNVHNNIYHGNMLDYFWKSFIIVEESEDNYSMDTYWCVFLHTPSGTYYKQSCYQDSYDQSARFDNSYWSIVRPMQVTVTNYMDV